MNIYECEFCGKEVRRSTPGKYCSHRCYSKGRKGVPLTEKIEKECKACKQHFFVLYKERNRVYCSRKCSDAKNKGVLRNPRIPKTCPQCGSKFVAPIPHPIKKYCSKACYHASRVGSEHSPETKAKMSKASKAGGVLKRLWNDPEFQRKRVRGLCKRPNKPEVIIQEILDEICPGEYKYTGNGSFIIDRMCPDFTNVNGQKKLIEVFGESFHDPKVAKKKLPIRATESGRRKAFAKFGYSMLVIWSREIYKGGNEGRQKLKDKIRGYHENRCD